MKENKRKSGGFTKEKYHGKSSKTNLSIALFDNHNHNHNFRENRDDTATTSNSNASYEPKTTKNI